MGACTADPSRLGDDVAVSIAGDAVTLDKAAVQILCDADAGCGEGLLHVDATGLEGLQGQAVMTTDGRNVPLQWLDSDQDGDADLLLLAAKAGDRAFQFTSDTPAKTEPHVQIVLSERQGAELNDGKLSGGTFVDVDQLTVPDWHTPGSGLVRMEGPAWESELVGYRLYLDNRNGTDIFAKAKTDMALQDVGFDGGDYHSLNDWGADVLKVGESLGIGAVGFATPQGTKRLSPEGEIAARVLDNGPLMAKLLVTSGEVPHRDATVDIRTTYSIETGSRLTRVDAVASAPMGDWVTGIVTHSAGELILSDESGPWGYVATFGPQSVFDDALGMAIFFSTAEAEFGGTDALNHVVTFGGERTSIHYYFAATWGADPGAIKTRDDFVTYLEQQRAALANAPSVRVLAPETP